jgi:hypothetical protein
VDQAVNAAHPRLRTMPGRRLSGSGHRDGYHAGTRADLGTSRFAGRRTAISN